VKFKAHLLFSKNGLLLKDITAIMLNRWLFLNYKLGTNSCIVNFGNVGAEGSAIAGVYDVTDS